MSLYRREKVTTVEEIAVRLNETQTNKGLVERDTDKQIVEDMMMQLLVFKKHNHVHSFIRNKTVCMLARNPVSTFIRFLRLYVCLYVGCLKNTNVSKIKNVAFPCRDCALINSKPPPPPPSPQKKNY